MVRLRRQRAQSPAEPCPLGLVWAGSWQQPVEGVHVLFLNWPPEDIPPDDGGATIVAAASLAHLGLSQPDASGCSTSLPAIGIGTPGALVFLSDLSAQLAGQRLSCPQVGVDHEAVTDRLIVFGSAERGARPAAGPAVRPRRHPARRRPRTSGSTSPRAMAGRPSYLAVRATWPSELLNRVVLRLGVRNSAHGRGRSGARGHRR
jgi:hypothetical protein